MEVRPHYKQTELGVIPLDWEVKQIGEFEPFVTSGSRGWATFYSDRGSPFLRITNLSRTRIYPDLQDLRFVKLAATDSEAARTQLRNGDVLISITADIGIVGHVTAEIPEPAYINQHIALVRFDLKRVNSRFVSYFLASEHPQRLFRALTDSGAKAGMNLRTVQQIRIAIPPTVKEQEAIAEALSDADALIESQEQLLAKKRRLKRGAMQELLRPKPNDEVRFLGDVSSLKGRIGWQGLKQQEFTTNDDEPFLITGMNFKDGAIRWSEVYHVSEARYGMAPEIQLRPNDVLMTKDGTIGKVLYIESIPPPGKASLNSHLLLFRPTGLAYNPKYLYYQLGSRRFQDFIELNKSGTTFFGLSQAAVARYPVLLPPVTEQARIAAVLSDIDTDIAGVEAKLAKDRQLKQGMTQQLLTGTIRLVGPTRAAERAAC